MSYVKLCQISSQSGSPLTCYYLEDCHGVVHVNNIQSYPISFQVEVITWVDLNNFNLNKSTISFVSETVTLSSQPTDSIRQEVFNQLISKYPGLTI